MYQELLNKKRYKKALKRKRKLAGRMRGGAGIDGVVKGQKFKKNQPKKKKEKKQVTRAREDNQVRQKVVNIFGPETKKMERPKSSIFQRIKYLFTKK